MSDLYRCPCCNKLVPASHFRRAPLAPEDIIALSLHPALERRMLWLIERALDTQPQPVLAQQPRTMKVKVAPPGYLTYAEVCQRYGIAEQTLRTYISQGKIKGGGGLVRRIPLERFMRNYKPRSSTRRS